MRILFGALYTPDYFTGLTTYNRRMIAGLEGKVDLHLLFGDSGDMSDLERPGVRIGESMGFPALFARRPRSAWAFSAPLEPGGMSDFVDDLAEAIRSLGINLVHLADWEAPFCIGAFAAARKAGVPWIISPVDYRLACPQNFFFYRGLKACSGPDRSFRKCSRCMSTQRPYWGGNLTRLKGLAKDLLYGLGVTWPLIYYESRERWKIRHEAIREQLEHCRSIVTMSAYHAGEMSRLLQLPYDRFKVIYYGVEEPGVEYLPRPERFETPLRFAWINRLGREWGIFLVLDAWRRCAIPSERAQLWVYSNPGTDRALRAEGFGPLIDRGNVIVREERVMGREDEVFPSLSAWIASPLWQENGPTPEPFSRRVPMIAPNKGSWDEIIQDGVGGFLYERGNAESLASLLRRLVDNPSLLRQAAEVMGFKREYGIDFMGERFVELYRTVLAI
jgi:glycosyltransferase involved in cell wall biosynthesis